MHIYNFSLTNDFCNNSKNAYLYPQNLTADSKKMNPGTNMKCRKMKAIMGDLIVILTIFTGIGGRKIKRDISICNQGTLRPNHKESTCFGRKQRSKGVGDTPLNTLLHRSEKQVAEKGRRQRCRGITPTPDVLLSFFFRCLSRPFLLFFPSSATASLLNSFDD